MGMRNFFTHGGKVVWGLILGFIAASVLSTGLLAKTAELRYQRDVNRMVYNDNLGLLEEVRGKLGATTDSLKKLLATPAAVAPDQGYLVVSIEERKLWYKKGTQTLFESRVATGSGKSLVNGPGGGEWKFETPRGRLRVQAKEVDPAWVPPDWHFIEQAKKRGLGIMKLSRGQSIPTSDGGAIAVSGANVVKRYADGREVAFTVEDGREVVANGNIIVPPFGTTQRRYKGVLGTRRLVMGDGYAIHGTNKPETIGQAVSHGCVRMRNEEIEQLFDMVPVGTPVYIY